MTDPSDSTPMTYPILPHTEPTYITIGPRHLPARHYRLMVLAWLWRALP